MKTAVDLPDSLFKELKIYSIESNRKLKEVIVLFLSQGLASAKTKSQDNSNKSKAWKDFFDFGAKLKFTKSPLTTLIEDRKK